MAGRALLIEPTDFEDEPRSSFTPWARARMDAIADGASPDEADRIADGVDRRIRERSLTSADWGVDPIPQLGPMAGDTGSGGGTLGSRLRQMLGQTVMIATPTQGGDFDPDAFLAKPAAAPAAPPAQDFDPDAFLGTGPARTATPTPAEPPGWGSTLLRYAGHVPGIDQVAGAVGALQNQDTLHRAMPYLIPFDKNARDAALHDYRFIRDHSREDREAGGEAHPSAKWSGIGAQTLLSLFAPVPKGTAAGAETAKAALTLGQRLLNASKVGGAMGAAGGLLDGSADLTKGQIGQAIVDTGTGAVTGAGLGLGLQGGLEGATALSAPLRRLANRMAARAAGFKKRDIDLATLGGKTNAAEKIDEIGNQLNEENLPRFGGTAESLAGDLRPVRERLGAEKGAAVDALDAARPVVQPSLNTLGIDVPAANSVTAGPDVPLRVPEALPYSRSPLGAPNPGTPADFTVAAPDTGVPSYSEPNYGGMGPPNPGLPNRAARRAPGSPDSPVVGMGEVPNGPAVSYPDATPTGRMIQTPIQPTERVLSLPTKAPKTLLSRKGIANALEDQADALARNPGASGYADALRREAQKIRDMPGGENLTFREAESIKSRYGKANNKLGENDTNEANKTISDTIKRRVEQEAEAVSPELAAKFREAKERFKSLKPAENAASAQERRDFANQLAGIAKVGSPLLALERLANGQPLQAAGMVAAPFIYKALEARAPSSAAALLRGTSRTLRGANLRLPQLSIGALPAAEQEAASLLHLPRFSPAMAESDDEIQNRAMLAALRTR